MSNDSRDDAIQRLPEDQRVVLALISIDGLSYKDAAEVLEVPLGTVMSRIARARRSLQRQLFAEMAPAVA